MTGFQRRPLAALLMLGAALFAGAPQQLSAQSAPQNSALSQKPDEPLNGTSDESKKTLYALGVLISRNLDDFHLSAQEFELVRSGLIDGFNHRSTDVNLTADIPKVQLLRQDRIAQTVKKRQEDGQAYLEQVAALPGARRTASGLVLVPIKPGKGPSPSEKDTVMVNFVGKLIDGTVFDMSTKGEPAPFALTAVIPCWSEALPLMKKGGKSRIVCPANLAYGLRGAPPKIASQSTLDFELELVAIGVPPGPAPTAKVVAPAEGVLSVP